MGREEGHSGRGAWGTEGEELLAAVIGDVFAGPPTPSHIMPPRHAPAAFPSPQVLTQSFQSSGQSSSSITRPGGPTWKPAGGPPPPLCQALGQVHVTSIPLPDSRTLTSLGLRLGPLPKTAKVIFLSFQQHNITLLFKPSWAFCFPLRGEPKLLQ